MNLEIKKISDFEYIDEGAGQPLILLHGLFGALSNWEGVVERFSKKYRVLIPLLPLYTLPLIKTSVPGLVKHLRSFIEHFGIENPVLIGNSLGGHLGLLYSISYPNTYHSLVLTGSSGLYENAMGGSFPKRGSREYLKEKTEYTFYDPKVATEELVDEVFDIANDKHKIIRVLAMSKSAIRQNLSSELHKIDKPVCLIWGKQDNVTPPSVAEDFHKLLPQSELIWIDKCGHAPMMEHPALFNDILEGFLNKVGL